jgi:hypothetical protein
MADDVLLRDDNIPPIQEELFRLYSQGFVTDITLSCEDGKIFEAHKVILSARSTYFYGLIPKLKGDPVIFLKGIKGAYLEKILKYVYSGSAAVPKSQLRSLFEVARALQIKGLVELAASSEMCRLIGAGVPTYPSPRSSAGSGLTPTGRAASDLSPGSSYGGKKSTREAKEAALQHQQKLYDMYSSSASAPGAVNSHKVNRSDGKGGRTATQDMGLQAVPAGKGGRTTTAVRTVKESLDQQEEEAFKFKYKHISDDSDELDNNMAGNDSDEGTEAGFGLKRSTTLKRRRGRPARMTPTGQKVITRESRSSSDDDTDTSDDTVDDAGKKDDDLSGSSDSDSESDNSDLDSDESVSLPKSPNHGRKGHYSAGRKREPSRSLDDYDIPTRASPQRRSQRGAGVNGQQVLTVQCKVCEANLFPLS